ncbi:MAG: DUF4395 domain-containing protein [Pseudomonadota bacterium]
MSTNSITRKRLEEQGFCGLDDETLAEVGPWLRWSPVLCTFVMILGVFLQSPVVLWLLAAIAFLGVFLPFHPFDLLYNYGVRHFTGTRPFPHNGPQRKFACGLASAWLVATGWAFYAGMSTLGFSLGIALILVAALVSVTNICIPSMIYNLLFGKKGSSNA